MLRHPGRLLAPGEFVPTAVVDFIGRQLDLAGDDLADYAVRFETRHEHLAELRRLYGFRSYSGGAARELVERLREEAEQAQSNEDLVLAVLRPSSGRCSSPTRWWRPTTGSAAERIAKPPGPVKRSSGTRRPRGAPGIRRAGTALIGARDTGEALDAVIADGPGWEGLGDLVAKAAALASTAVSDPLNHVLGGYSRFRRYTPRMLRTLDIEASPAAEPLLEAVGVLRSDGTARPTGFLRPNSRWSRLLRTQSDHRLWETAVLFHLRAAFRDVWLAVPPSR